MNLVKNRIIIFVAIGILVVMSNNMYRQYVPAVYSNGNHVNSIRIWDVKKAYYRSGDSINCNLIRQR